MSPSTPRQPNGAKKSLVGLSFAFPMQMPTAGTGAGQDRRDPKRRPDTKR